MRARPGLRLPVNVEAEQALLGSLLLCNAGYAQIRGIVVAEDFSEATHGRVFDALVQLIEAGEPANPVTMAHLFNTDPEAFPAGNPGAYLMRLAAAAVTLINHHCYAGTIADCARRRDLMGELEDVRPLETAVDVLDRHREAIESLRRAQRRGAGDAR